MTIAIVVRCDGTPADRPSIPLAECRASFPTQTEFVGLAIDQAVDHGWSRDGKRHLCPACTGARAKRSVFK